jgi:hypothetical protein
VGFNRNKTGSVAIKDKVACVGNGEAVAGIDVKVGVSTSVGIGVSDKADVISGEPIGVIEDMQETVMMAKTVTVVWIFNFPHLLSLGQQPNGVGYLLAGGTK